MGLVRRRRLLPAVVVIVAALLAGLLQVARPAPAAAAVPDPVGQITVLTQNQHVGTDLRPVLTAPDQPTFQKAIRKALDEIGDNRFQLRALALAHQIVKAKADVVALQEVFDLRRNGVHAAGPYRDHLADTLAALKLLGGQYEVVARLQNMSATFPVDLDKNGTLESQVKLTDYDVILVRKGLAATPVPFPAKCARPSLDGCQFQAVSIATQLPNGRVNRERGWVGVDVSVNGRAYRIVNTHVEEPDIEPETGDLSRTFQAFQTTELITMLRQSEPTGRTVIVLGDLASRPEDEAILIGTLAVVPPHHQLRTNGFNDAVALDPDRPVPGNTCCQAANLRNKKSQLARRVDHIFVSATPVQVHTDVLGDSPLERLLLKRWPSDHGTVYARLRFG
jgi:endonuclease/exonuclease/phosphatase family metal-dependent hydrolase